MTAIAKGAAESLSATFGQRRGRDERRAAYQEMHVRVLRTRLRIDNLLAIHRARHHPLDLVAAYTGYPTSVMALDRVLVDLAEVMDSWHSVRAHAPAPVARGADEVLTSLAGLLTNVNPGWHRPAARRRAKQLAHEATEHFSSALAEFDRLTTADAAPQRRTRKAAQRRTGGWAPTGVRT